MQYKLYTTSIKAWDAMLKSINQAQKTIYLEMYILLDDTKISHDFLGKLKQKARNGVRVVVVADAYGSRVLKKEITENIQDSGVEFIFFSNWLRHVHRKVLIVDEKIAFVGGVNIGKRFSKWHDLQIKLHGRIVKRILRSFAYTYEMAGGKDEKIISYREKKFSAKLKFWVLEHSPIRNIYSLRKHYQEKITAAQKSIVIATPYFTPPRWLISLLDDAIRRGVKVEVLIPEISDIPIMDRVNYHYVYQLHNLGVEIYLSRDMNHSKLLLIDDEEGLIGSQNIDLMSFRMNAEVGIFSREPKLVKELGIIFNNWKRDALKFTPKHYKMRLVDYIIFALSKILRPIL